MLQYYSEGKKEKMLKGNLKRIFPYPFCVSSNLYRHSSGKAYSHLLQRSGHATYIQLPIEKKKDLLIMQLLVQMSIKVQTMSSA